MNDVITRFHRCNPRTGFRQIANEAGEPVADCPSYQDGPSLEEAKANAAFISAGADHAEATPGPWYASEAVGGGWLVRGGPRHVIVAMVRQRSDQAEIAARIAACRPADANDRSDGHSS